MKWWDSWLSPKWRSLTAQLILDVSPGVPTGPGNSAAAKALYRLRNLNNASFTVSG